MPPKLDREAEREWVRRARATALRPQEPIMLKDTLRALWELATSDMTPDERRGAWMLVSRGLVRVVAILAMGHILWACGWLAWIQYNDKPLLGAGFMTVAMAEETIDERVAETLKPLKEEMATLSRDQRDMKIQLTAVHKLLIEREIREKACAYFFAAPNSDQRNLANEAIRELQRQYRVINSGQNYEIPKSEDLRCSANTAR